MAISTGCAWRSTRHCSAFAEVGDRWGLATTLSELSSLLILDGDLDGAEHALEQTQSLMAELGASDGGAMMQLRLADVRARRGDLEGARRCSWRTSTKERFAEERAMIKVTLAYLTVRLGETAAPESSRARRWRTRPRRAPAPEQGHARAMALNGAASVEIEAGALEDGAVLIEAYRWRSPPGTCRSWRCSGDARRLAQRRGHNSESAEILGAAARLRGAEDRTHPEVARLTATLREQLGEAFADWFARGRALDRDGALARLDPAPARRGGGRPAAPAGRTPRAGPHPQQRPQHVCGHRPAEQQAADRARRGGSAD